LKQAKDPGEENEDPSVQSQPGFSLLKQITPEPQQSIAFVCRRGSRILIISDAVA